MNTAPSVSETGETPSRQPTDNKVRSEHLKAIASEIGSLRGWLDYLERDITREEDVIHALILASISESCMKLIYNAGIVNGAKLHED